MKNEDRIREQSRIPKYQQLIDNIIADIQEGVLKYGDKLPSINESSEDLYLSRDTVERAYKKLRDLGNCSQGTESFRDQADSRMTYTSACLRKSPAPCEQLRRLLWLFKLGDHGVSSYHDFSYLFHLEGDIPKFSLPCRISRRSCLLSLHSSRPAWLGNPL